VNTYPAFRTVKVPPFAWAMVAALAATTLDLAFASMYWAMLHDVSPTRVMQAIAAHWGWGREAYSGGMATAALGAGLFLGRMLLLAVIYQLAARRHATLIERPYTWGALFGLAIYLSNRYVVVPLIGALPLPAYESDWAWASSCVLAHMLLIGIPLALFARLAVRED
jgi:uncharacterized membrane protein YagU involved in acid resistance